MKKYPIPLMLAVVLLFTITAADAGQKVYTSPQGYSFSYPDRCQLNVTDENVVLTDETSGVVLIFRKEQIKELRELGPNISLPTIAKKFPELTTTIEKGFDDFKKDGFVLTNKGEYRIATKDTLLYEYAKGNEARLRSVLFTHGEDLYVVMMMSRAETYATNSKMIDQIVTSVKFK